MAAYCRVSTLRDEQDESFSTQQKYDTDMIRNYPDWELVKIYADPHSSTKTKKRPGFQERLADVYNSHTVKIEGESIRKKAAIELIPYFV